MTNIDVGAIATEAAQVDEAIMKALPFASTLLEFVPGAQVAVPFLPLVGEGLSVLDNALRAVAAGNPGMAAKDVFQEVINHLTPGAPNSPILSAPPPTPETQDPSAQGSG